MLTASPLKQGIARGALPAGLSELVLEWDNSRINKRSRLASDYKNRGPAAK